MCVSTRDRIVAQRAADTALYTIRYLVLGEVRREASCEAVEEFAVEEGDVVLPVLLEADMAVPGCLSVLFSAQWFS